MIYYKKSSRMLVKPWQKVEEPSMVLWPEAEDGVAFKFLSNSAPKPASTYESLGKLAKCLSLLGVNSIVGDLIEKITKFVIIGEVKNILWFAATLLM